MEDDNESRFFRQDLRTGGADLFVLAVGRGTFVRVDDIKRITSSSGSMAGSGTLFNFGARGVPEPTEAFDFFKDKTIVRESGRKKSKSGAASTMRDQPRAGLHSQKS